MVEVSEHGTPQWGAPQGKRSQAPSRVHHRTPDAAPGCCGGKTPGARPRPQRPPGTVFGESRPLCSLTGAYPPGVLSALAHHTYPVTAGLHRGLFHCGAGKEKPRSGCGTPRLCLSLKPPEGIQAYTVQMPQPSEDRIARNLPKVKPENYQNVGSCQLLR